jgi:hypothetical protein
MKDEYEVLPWHNRGWHCYNYIDQWGNHHSEVKIPWDNVITDIGFGGGYGHDSWAATYYLLDSGEIIHSSFYGFDFYCKVYKNENVIVKSIVMGLWAEKNHPKVNIDNLEQFKQIFPLIYRIVKYYYCVKHLRWISVTVYDKRYRSICD